MNDNIPELVAIPKGVGRVSDNQRCLLVSFDRIPTDNDIRAVHEYLRLHALCEPCDVCGSMVDKTADACSACG
jgi:hypothetical protein